MESTDIVPVQQGELIPVQFQPEFKEIEINTLFASEGGRKNIQALLTLGNAQIPKGAIRDHPGKGKRTVTYIDHAWAKDIIRDALSVWWSFEATNGRILPDGSAIIDCTFTLFHLMSNGQILTRKFTEPGVFDKRNEQSDAMRIASAASRGFCRVIATATGLGMEFYRKEDKMTPEDFVNMLVAHGSKNGLKRGEIEKAIYTAYPKPGDLEPNFPNAYRMICDLIDAKKGIKPVVYGVIEQDETEPKPTASPKPAAPPTPQELQPQPEPPVQNTPPVAAAPMPITLPAINSGEDTPINRIKLEAKKRIAKLGLDSKKASEEFNENLKKQFISRATNQARPMSEIIQLINTDQEAFITAWTIMDAQFDPEVIQSLANRPILIDPETPVKNFGDIVRILSGPGLEFTVQQVKEIMWAKYGKDNYQEALAQEYMRYIAGEINECHIIPPAKLVK